jgi:hypothetical protein
MLNGICGLTLKQAAAEIRKHSDTWLALVTQAERWLEKYPITDPMLCIAVAWLSFEEDRRLRRYRILFGEHQKILDDLSSITVHGYNFFTVGRVLHALRANAAAAGIELPARLTVAQDEPGYAQWRDEIAAYQERAGMRSAKLATPLTPA